ncbi:MAG: T9SS type A sorting domain-containing protein [Bacteroidetes bacterium]|nr:T9SS type A sorting domain-containing protein [Bacteroidota bacterium]
MKMLRMKNLNKTLLLALTTCTVTAFGQTVTKGIKWTKQSASNITLADVNVETGDVVKSIMNIKVDNGFEYSANSFTYDQKNDLVFFMVGANGFNSISTNQMVVARASTGEVLRKLNISGSMSPFVLTDKNQMGFIGTERTSHGYGNNDDDISLKVFDLSEGKPVVSVKLPSLSFASVPAPFIGETSNNNGTKTQKDVSLSSTLFLPDRNEIIFSARDVMGIQRLFRIDLEQQTLISKLSLDFDVIDMAYDANKKSIHVLYLRPHESGEFTLEAATMNLFTREMKDVQVLRTLQKSEFPITDGSIRVNEDKIYISKNNPAGRQDLFVLNAEDNVLVSTSTSASSNDQIDFEFPVQHISSNVVTLDNLVTLFPNPATGTVTVKSDNRALVTYVLIRNDIGQVVQEVKIETGMSENTLDISTLTSGIYMVEVQTDASSPINQKLVVH